jgi:hypothetical protein
MQHHYVDYTGAPDRPGLGLGCRRHNPPDVDRAGMIVTARMAWVATLVVLISVVRHFTDDDAPHDQSLSL